MEPKIERREDRQLWVVRGKTASRVRVKRCFPWTEPSRYISLRDDQDNELALVKCLTRLDRDSRAVMEEALAEAGFVLEIIRLESLERDFEIRSWTVETRQGPRTFQTKLDDWPRALPNGGLLIRDVAGDLFYIPNPGALDFKSQRLLWAFVD